MKNRRNKWVCGPGGLYCPCCRKGSLQDAKVGFRRSERRKNKKINHEE